MDIALARTWVEAIALAITEQKDYLTKLDSAIGDGDHGTNMDRGFATAVQALAESDPATVGDVLITTGSSLISSVGGASGPLYGGAFRSMGKALPAPEVATGQFAAALASGLATIQRLGAAQPDDKTIIDAYAPALGAFQQTADGDGHFLTAAQAAADAAEAGMRATIPMQAHKGRASYLGPRSVGHQDPGATSTALIFRTLAEVMAGG